MIAASKPESGIGDANMRGIHYVVVDRASRWPLPDGSMDAIGHSVRLINEVPVLPSWGVPLLALLLFAQGVWWLRLRARE
jgi:hypothetical protein